MITSHSPDTSLVLVNLPDPPALSDTSPNMKHYIEFMDYLEGVAEGLPRVLYVHGSGQEIINLDHID